jgi:hypothetical protein
MIRDDISEGTLVSSTPIATQGESDIIYEKIFSSLYGNLRYKWVYGKELDQSSSSSMSSNSSTSSFILYGWAVDDADKYFRKIIKYYYPEQEQELLDILEKYCADELNNRLDTLNNKKLKDLRYLYMDNNLDLTGNYLLGFGQDIDDDIVCTMLLSELTNNIDELQKVLDIKEKPLLFFGQRPT